MGCGGKWDVGCGEGKWDVRGWREEKCEGYIWLSVGNCVWVLSGVPRRLCGLYGGCGEDCAGYSGRRGVRGSEKECVE